MGAQADLAVELLCAGLARLPKLKRVRDAASRDAITALSSYEDEARTARRGIFTYGDPGARARVDGHGCCRKCVWMARCACGARLKSGTPEVIPLECVRVPCAGDSEDEDAAKPAAGAWGKPK